MNRIVMVCQQGTKPIRPESNLHGRPEFGVHAVPLYYEQNPVGFSTLLISSNVCAGSST